MHLSHERRCSYGRSSQACPVEIGKEYEVNIAETSRQGEGIARIQGFVIFAANAKPRDHAEIRIARMGRRAANAETVR